MAKQRIEINCEEVWRQISNYLDDGVDSGLRNTMSSHFKDCTHCSAVLDGARDIVKLVGDGRAFEIPSGVGETFYKKLNDYLATRQPRSADARPARGDEPQHKRSPIRWCSRG